MTHEHPARGRLLHRFPSGFEDRSSIVSDIDARYFFENGVERLRLLSIRLRTLPPFHGALIIL